VLPRVSLWCGILNQYHIRASPPTTTNPSFSFMGRSSFMWRAWSRSINFSLTAGSEGRDWLEPMVKMRQRLKSIVQLSTQLRSRGSCVVVWGSSSCPTRCHSLSRLSGGSNACKGLVPAPLRSDGWRKAPVVHTFHIRLRAFQHDAYMRDKADLCTSQPSDATGRSLIVDRVL
jgi:hypothetical protein